MCNKKIPEEPTIDKPPEQNLVRTLSIMSGRKRGRVVTVEKENFVIGRGRGSDLDLPDENVSRSHAEILLKDGAYTIRDLGSRWGTHIRGGKITESPLKYGDEFEVAGVLLKFDVQKKSDLFPKKARWSRVLLYVLITIGVISSLSLGYYYSEVKKNLGRPGGDVLSQIIHHYDQGIIYYNQYDSGDEKKKELAVEEMKKVIELDPDSKTRFSRSARRIIDGLEK